MRDIPQAGNFDRNLAVVDPVHELAARKAVTSSQLTLAWVFAQGQDIVPISGTKRRTYFEENVGAFEVVFSQ